MTNTTVSVREIAPGVQWLSACLVSSRPSGPIHIHGSTYLVLGEDKALLVDAGHPRFGGQLLDALDGLLGDRPLDYVFPTHPEMPHSGNLPVLIQNYPAIEVCADPCDYHLYWPQVAPRLRPMRIGDRLDLGGRAVHFVEAVIRDLPNTLWAYDDRSQTLFVSDGFSYAHHHMAGECVLLSGELRSPPDLDQIGAINDAALYFTRYVDLDEYFARFDQLVTQYPVALLGPAHGGVISNPEEMVPRIKRGMQEGRRNARAKLGL